MCRLQLRSRSYRHPTLCRRLHERTCRPLHLHRGTLLGKAEIRKRRTESSGNFRPHRTRAQHFALCKGRLKKQLDRFRLPTFIMADDKPSVRHFKFGRHLMLKTVCQEKRPSEKPKRVSDGLLQRWD